MFSIEDGGTSAAADGGAESGAGSRGQWLAEPYEEAAAPKLTRRERDVLACVASGEAPKEIAQSLGISVHTCRGHIKALHSKLGVRSQVEVVIKAYGLGLLNPKAGS